MLLQALGSTDRTDTLPYTLIQPGLMQPCLCEGVVEAAAVFFPTLLPGLLNWLMEIMRCTRLTLPSRRTYLRRAQQREAAAGAHSSAGSQGQSVAAPLHSTGCQHSTALHQMQPPLLAYKA